MTQTNDERGAAGEARFSELCARAKLICNKSERDRAGWDFIVDFEHKYQMDISLDKRPGPLSCIIQVKTIASKAGNVRLRLSMAERLAKDLKPNFIYVLRADTNGDFVGAYLIHIFDDRLASILKRLRKETAKRHKNAGLSEKINQVDISLTPTAAERMDVTHVALRTALESACGPDMATYSRKKNHQLLNLGYGRDRIQMEVAFQATSIDEIEDVFLGIKNDIAVSILAATETRFDIALPENMMSNGMLKIESKASSIHRLTFRAPGVRPVPFTGEVFTPPPSFLHNRKRMRLISRFVEINFTSIKGGATTINIAVDFKTDAGTVAEWTEFFLIGQCLFLKGTLDIESNNNVNFRLPLTGSSNSFPDSLEGHLHLCEQLALIIHKCGLDSESKYAWGDLFDARYQIKRLHDFSTKKKISFAAEKNDTSKEVKLHDGYFVHSVKIGSKEIGYYFSADLTTSFEKECVRVVFSNISICGTRNLNENYTREMYIEDIRRWEATEQVGWINTLPS